MGYFLRVCSLAVPPRAFGGAVFCREKKVKRKKWDKEERSFCDMAMDLGVLSTAI